VSGGEGPQRAAPRERSTTPPRRPNLLVVTTDDQTLGQFIPEAMPFTWRLFAHSGTVFTQAMAVPPLCCPSRAGFLTGQYAHNHGVLTNDAGYLALRRKHNILPVWLQRDGYRTALIGKYLNGFPALSWASPPGWDRSFVGGGEVGYRDFDVGVGESSYSTDVYTDAAQRFIQKAEREHRRFFLWLTYNAPHTALDGTPPCQGDRAQPATARDFAATKQIPLPAAPTPVEGDRPDKGPWLRSLEPLSRAELRRVRRNWHCALSSLPAVDRGIRRLVRVLQDRGELRRTIIVFTSDNGYFYGEHLIRAGKELPYDPALRVPMAIWLPPALRGAAPDLTDALVSAVDLAPTLLDYADASPCREPARCRTLDGRSLRGMLTGRQPGWARDRALPIELDDTFAYTAFRTDERLVVRLRADRTGRLAAPELQVFDLRLDPRELDSLTASLSPRRRRAALARLRELHRCRGTAGPRACP
jgi:N-acetylglucosamine-6-sulfatase